MMATAASSRFLDQIFSKFIFEKLTAGQIYAVL